MMGGKVQRKKTTRNGDGNGDRNRNRNGNGEPGAKKKNGKDIMSICLLYETTLSRRVVSIGIDPTAADGGFNMAVAQPLPKQPGAAIGAGFASLGSKIYVLGGDDERASTFPKRVYVLDVNTDVNPELRWEEGPSLKGAKPNPVVFTVNEKIYALSGESLWGRKREVFDNVFEVLKRRERHHWVRHPRDEYCWETLPDPPFVSMYNDPDGLELRGHTLIGVNIYVNVEEPSGNVTQYSFNVEKEEWKSHDKDVDGCLNVRRYGQKKTNEGAGEGAAGSDKLILHNLRTLYDLDYGTDVVDYLLYQTDNFRDPGKGVKVYALDLTVSADYLQKQWENIDIKAAETFLSSYVSSRFEISDCSYPSDDHLVTVPVLGLNHVTDTIPGTRCNRGFVAHLRDNIFCFVCLYCTRASEQGFLLIPHLRACVFEVTSVVVLKGSYFIKRLQVAKNVKEKDFILDSELVTLSQFSTWCKIPNEGRQIHFQRYQFQHEGQPDSYQDDVAGKVVRKVLDNHFKELDADKPIAESHNQRDLKGRK